MTEARKVRVIQGYGSEAGRFSFSEAEICLLPGGKEITLELGDGFIANFTSPPSPPKLYTFAEAYAMMKAGKKMQCTLGSSVFWMENNGIVYALNGYQENHGRCSAVFGMNHIEGKWQEANP